MRQFGLLLVVASLVAGATTGLTAEKVYDVSISAIPNPAGLRPIEGALVSETWGFEAAEGFAPGFIGGQVGWTAFTVSIAEAHVDTVNPSAGAQHLRISYDQAVTFGTLIGAFSPVVSDLVVDASSVSVQVAIGATGGADYDIVPQAPSQGLLTARVKFSYLGDILVLDDIGGGLTFVDTGTDWVPGSYQLLTIAVDPIGGTIDYSYGGSLIYSSVAGVFAGTLVEQVVLLSDNFNVEESGDFDDLVIERGAIPVELQTFTTE